jgi:hypothetical protein
MGHCTFKRLEKDIQCRDHSVQLRKKMLCDAIEQNRNIPYVVENSDPLLFWKGCYLLGSALESKRPLAASMAAVSATQTICETLFRSGGQMLPARTIAAVPIAAGCIDSSRLHR